MIKSLFVAALFAATATAASANVVIISGGIPGNPAENVLLNGGSSGTTISGTTNQTSSLVTFQGTESLTAPSNGQARIEATDGAYNSLSFFLTNPSLGFTAAEFNLNAATSGNATISALDQFGDVFTQTFAIGSNGENFFNLTSNSGEIIKQVNISTTASLSDTRQVRLGGVTAGVVPEPAAWAMMIFGMGMVGAGMRMRRRRELAATA